MASRLLAWLDRRADRFNSSRAPRLHLDLPDRIVNFRGMKEFEFALSSRIEFPAARVRDLVALTPAELEASATKIRQLERDFYLLDDDNNTYPLRVGKNLLGRHSTCDVVLDSACRAVSRTHLIVQPISEHEVRLTDLSSHGTEVPARFLRKHH